jgi:hypothetical protein
MTLTPQQNSFLESATAIQLDRDKTEAAFLARQLVQATLPHSDPKDVPLWTRTNGNLTLSIKPDWEQDPQTHKPRNVGIPYGTIPRLLLFWITTEAVKTKSRRLELGDSLSAFMRELGLQPTGGRWGSIPRLREQMTRLFRAKISFDSTQTVNGRQGKAWLDMQIAPKGEFWWSHHQPEQGTLWKSWIELGESFFEAITSSPIPVDTRALKALKRSPLALDLYSLLCYECYRVHKNGKPRFIPWRALMMQLGADYEGDYAARDFAVKCRKALRKIQAVMPTLNLEIMDGGFTILEGSTPPIASQTTPRLQKAN